MRTRLFKRRGLAWGAPLLVLLVSFLVTIPGDFAPVTAQPTPDIDEVLPQLEAVPGVINAYRTPEGRLFLEVTKEHFEKDFLVVIQMDRGIGENFMLTGFPLTSEMVTFRLRNEKIELVTRNPYFRAQDRASAKRMVELGFRESVRRAFKPVALNAEQGRYLIDATGLFVSDWPGLKDFLPFLYGVAFQQDPNRSQLVSVKGFETNLEVKVDLTFLSSGPIPSGTLPDPKTLPIAYHYSVLALPDEPMKPRLADDRVGYFTTTYKSYDKQSGPSDAVRLTNRWRLEKKDPYAALSEPVKPIVYYLENTIPVEFRPYIKAGIEAWNAAFEQAGFVNAIVAKDQPLDPDWDPGDARYSTIRWMPSTTSTFAIGPSDVDPRSGQILNADILFVSDWVRVLNGQYDQLVSSEAGQFGTHLAQLNPDNELIQWYNKINADYAQRLCNYATGMTSELALMRSALLAQGVADENGELPLEYLGNALKELVMHEVGHTLGLRHNFKASSAVPLDHLHDVELTKEIGVSASVMDYNPPNIALDPSQQGEFFNSNVGAYDKWAIQWGYQPVGNETLAPHPELAALAEEGYKKAYAYATDEDVGSGPFALDPYTITYDLSSDPVAWFQQRAMLVAELWDGLEDKLIADGEEYWPLRYAAENLLIQKLRGYPQGAKVLGGMEVSRAHKGNPMGITPFTPLSANAQRRALDYLVGLYAPQVIADFPPDLLNKMTTERWLDWASSWQFGQRFTYAFDSFITEVRVLVLAVVFQPERLMRIREIARRSSEADPFTLDEVYTGFTDGIWADVLAGRAPEDDLQREIQNAYLTLLVNMAKQTPPNTLAISGDASAAWISDARSLAYAELVRLNDAVDALLASGVTDRTAYAHLLQAQRQLKDVLGL